ncbi:thermonuclease family protein [Haladaptatus sp. NG-WS-4]
MFSLRQDLYPHNAHLYLVTDPMNNRTYTRSITLVLVALMMVFAGCSSSTTADTKTTTTATTALPTETSATTDTTTETSTTTDTTISSRQFDVQIINTQPNPTGPGLQNFDLKVTVDTRMADADTNGPGEPALAVKIDDNWITETQQLPQKRTGTYTIQLEQNDLNRYSGAQTIRVELLDKDVLGDDLIDVWEDQVNFGAKPRPPSTTTQPVETTPATVAQSTSTTTTQPPTSTTEHTTTTASTTTRATPVTTVSTTDSIPPTTIPSTTRSTTTSPASTTTSTTPTTTDELVDSGSKTSWTVEVVRVVDGDTYEVEFPDGHTEDVRLLGVDTPEVHVENTPDEFEGIPTTQDGEDWLRDWGHKASEFARTQVAGETVTIKTDDRADRRGSYGRLLVYVYTDDSNSVNEMLIEQGYARMYDSEFSQRSEFASDEQSAQENHVGLWNYEAPDDGGDSDSRSASQLVVSEIQADAPGNDHDNLNEEYITFTNEGDSELTLTSWTIEDAAKHQYSVPKFTLGAGESVTLYTGSGSNSANELFWGSGSAIWNNGGDTIIVTTSSGETVIQKEYN